MTVDAECARRDAPLAELPAGEAAVLSSFTLDDDTVRRLLELGFLPGTEVRVVRRAPFGCPLEVDVVGARYTLREETAAGVRVSRRDA